VSLKNILLVIFRFYYYSAAFYDTEWSHSVLMCR